MLYYIGENLSQPADEIAARLAAVWARRGRRGVRREIERVFFYAAWPTSTTGYPQSPFRMHFAGDA